MEPEDDVVDEREHKHEHEHEHEGLIDRMRHSGVGVEDPNIVGDVGPVDVAPGGDGESLIQEADPDDHRPIEV